MEEAAINILRCSSVARCVALLAGDDGSRAAEGEGQLQVVPPLPEASHRLHRGRISATEKINSLALISNSSKRPTAAKVQHNVVKNGEILSLVDKDTRETLPSSTKYSRTVDLIVKADMSCTSEIDGILEDPPCDAIEEIEVSTVALNEVMPILLGISYEGLSYVLGGEAGLHGVGHALPYFLPLWGGERDFPILRDSGDKLTKLPGVQVDRWLGERLDPGSMPDRI